MLSCLVLSRQAAEQAELDRAALWQQSAALQQVVSLLKGVAMQAYWLAWTLWICFTRC